MDIARKLELLQEIYSEPAELDRMLGKLLELALSQHRLRLQRYDQELGEFERRYGMDSAAFYQQFEAGKLGDAIDFFEWSGLYELRQHIREKIRQLRFVLGL
ncbi:MAG TPA: hypothetical protein IGS52_12310 [Oscillatoriaceae cyanobacterium M33_DOE_052]|uniref:Uncharacterized protein n=1 Tax=Planktothricoides sp. SpSt-374 TaxID=2282167 RepID=A0A7C3ZNF2_9CYAN|nr:hypothetical protein [Oscillatoriaceae cyanobacterium M33_DOE_052]